ncbi:hypothetical protein LMG28727_02657 [Paraburkholderia kirstenboschensis]|nr:hypothetical protein LMG28727_02657 [Paraburkholderia kirstenboschensis]
MSVLLTNAATSHGLFNMSTGERMRRYHLKQGDHSSAGGIVLEGEETCTHFGTAMTYLGAKVYCPTCKTVGVIAGKGPRLSDTMMGKEAALDGDICVCNCEPPPVMSASQNNSYQQVNPGALALSPLANESAWPHTAPSSMSSHKYSQRIFIADSVTGEPLRNRSFIVDVEGEQRSGETDGDGYAELATNSSQAFRIHIVFSSPKRELSPHPGV